MDIPSDMKFTKEHEWVSLDGDIATIGITDYAQGELGDIVYVELPAAEREVKQGESFITIESVKAVSDIYAPVSGKLVEVNPKLEEQPELLNESPHDRGWLAIIEMSDPEELEKLMSAADYEKLLEKGEG